MFSSVLFVPAAGKEERCLFVRCQVKFEAWFSSVVDVVQWRREIRGILRMWWRFSAASVHGVLLKTDHEFS